MEISLGEYNLVHSGIIIQIKDMPIKIKIKDEVEGDFTFIINFVTDTTDKASNSNFIALDKFTIQVDLKNFNHFQNGGNTELVELGTLRTKPLFFNYRVFDLNNVGMTFMFNFYTREDFKNG
ncbi:DUF6864 domain-containing function [Flavobacterium sp.]|uniref:DUF6864 domain-containing function n=1 Tax=Flavobacterium sp. TaxID=239 RepID=UPI00286F8E20|nr:hypothetical protein [Flavobacterium sp.]